MNEGHWNEMALAVNATAWVVLTGSYLYKMEKI